MSPTQKTKSLDRDLVARCVHDPVAFAELYDHYFPYIYKYFLYRVGNTHETEDLTSRVFERVVAKIRGYREDKAPFKNWIFSIAHNTLVDHIRLKKRNKCVPVEMMGQIACAGDSLADAMIRGEELVILLNAIKNLSERERELISLKFATGLTNVAISEITGLTKSNVATIIYRAVKKLRSELDALGWDSND